MGDEGGRYPDPESDDEGCLDDDDDVCCLVLGLVRATFLTRRMDSAAEQSMKAKVALFHNFILERGGALKLCWEKKCQGNSNNHSLDKQTSHPVV